MKVLRFRWNLNWWKDCIKPSFYQSKISDLQNNLLPPLLLSLCLLYTRSVQKYLYIFYFSCFRWAQIFYLIFIEKGTRWVIFKYFCKDKCWWNYPTDQSMGLCDDQESGYANRLDREFHIFILSTLKADLW